MSRITNTFSLHSDCIRCFTKFPNGQLASGGWDMNIFIWDPTNSEIPSKILTGHTGCVNALVSLSEYKLASGSADRTVRIWKFENSKWLVALILQRHYDAVTCLASVDCDRIASGTYDNKVLIWDVNTGACLGTLNGHQSEIIALMPGSGGSLISIAKLSEIFLWNIADGSKSSLRCVEGKHTVSYTGLEENGIACGCSDGSIVVIPESGDLVRVQAHAGSVTSLQHRNGFLVSGSTDRAIRIWQVKPMTMVKVVTVESEVWALLLLSSGLLAVGGNPHAYILDAELGRLAQAQTLSIVPKPELRLDVGDIKTTDKVMRGPCAEVREGWLRSSVPVVVKVFDRVALDTAAIKSVRSELAALSELRHPNLVSIIGVIELSQSPLRLVFERSAVASLSLFLQLNKLSWKQKLHIAYNLASGLAYLHERKIVHGNIKSPNALLCEDCTAQWSDFALPSLQAPSFVMRWASPEQAMDVKIILRNQSTDVWAFGMVLFELACGEAPFKDDKENNTQIRSKLLRCQLDEIPSDCVANCSGFADILRSCRERNGNLRPNATKLMDDFQQLSSSFVEKPTKTAALEKEMKFKRADWIVFSLLDFDASDSGSR